MPSLTVESSGNRRGGVITSRVLIGRLPTNGVVLGESSVSRLHAWIDCDLDGHYYVADTGSLTGTWVNNKAVDRRHVLQDGDVIRVGKTQLTFHESSDLPPELQPINLAGYPPLEDVDQAGVLFECVCGAPAWFKATAIGHPHKCRQCGRTVTIPDKPGVRAHPIGEPVGTAETFAAHALAEPSTAHATATAAVGELPHRHDEHGLSESFAGQTAVAEAELPTAIPVEEHGLAEIEPAPETGEAGFDFGVPSESSESAGHASTEASPYEYAAASDSAGPSPTLEQMLQAEAEPVPSEVEPEPIAEESFRTTEPVEVDPSFEQTSIDHATPFPAEEEFAPHVGEMATGIAEEPPPDLIAALHNELAESPPAHTHDPMAEPPARERASLFASRRNRPLAEPQPVATEEMAVDPVSELPPATEEALTPAVPSPLDAFDGYTADEAAVATIAGAAAVESLEERTDANYAPPDDETSGTQTCSVCHSAIGPGEATTTCPSCGLTFHAECWNENQGCSAYGCPQVGVLAPKEQPAAVEVAATGEAAAYDSAEPEESFPWEYLYLIASIIGTLLGLLVFGVPALIAAVGTLIYKLRFPDPGRRNGVVTLSILLAVLGIGLGVVASVYWWFGGFANVDWGRLRKK